MNAKSLLVAAALAVAAAGAWAAPPVNTFKPGSSEQRTDTAIQGYDTVAYFTDGKAVRGEAAHATEWMGARWLFASQAHLDLFNAHPERYAPQYGGYCAFGAAQGYLVKIEPDQWRIVDGKLYLNYDAAVQAKWVQDIPGYVQRADAKFPALLQK
jgi:YHS domain-containing protein